MLRPPLRAPCWLSAVQSWGRAGQASESQRGRHVVGVGTAWEAGVRGGQPGCVPSHIQDRFVLWSLGEGLGAQSRNSCFLVWLGQNPRHVCLSVPSDTRGPLDVDSSPSRTCPHIVRVSWAAQKHPETPCPSS